MRQSLPLATLVLILLTVGWTYFASGVSETLITSSSPSIPFGSTQFPPAASADNNLVADNVVTVTFVYFYYENVVQDWENQIRADMTDIEEVYRQCPELRDFGIDFCDFENFVSRYTDLSWEWRFYGEVKIPELAEKEVWIADDVMAYWHRRDPVEAEKVWDSSDIVFGIVEGPYTGGGANNWGFAFVGTGALWFPPMPTYRRFQLGRLAHELIHNFGAPDHYSPSHEHYGEDNDCIFGGYCTLDNYSILCDFCLGRIHWEYLGKADKRTIFHTGNLPASLINGFVSPPSGEVGTSFTFEVTYKDPDGDAPLYNVLMVYIDGKRRPMTFVSGTYEEGAIYRYIWKTTPADEGPHTYYFEANNGYETVRYPASGTMSGPAVTEAGGISPLYVTAGAAIIVVLLGLFWLKKRRR